MVQSPHQEIAERVAEVAPGLAAAAHLSAVQDARQLQADHRRRLADSHRAQMQALGMESTESPGGDDVGNLVITGDVYGSDAAEIVRALQGNKMDQPASVTPQQPVNSAVPDKPGMSKWIQSLIAGGLLAVGSGIGWGVNWLASKPAAPVNTTVIQPGENQQLGIEVVEGGAIEHTK